MRFKYNRKNLLVDAHGKPLQYRAAHDYGYDAADWNRYNQDFTVNHWTPSALLGVAAKNLRARAQDLERNSDAVRGFLAKLEINVVGWNGIRLQSKATRSAATDTEDNPARATIEAEWNRWTSPEYCSASEDLGLTSLLKMVLRRLIVDGECFVEMLPGFDNEYNFAVRIWEADACPVGYTDENANISFGIRKDEWGRAKEYYFHPTGNGNFIFQPNEDLIAVPANRIRHIFIKERPKQARGITYLASTAERMHMLSKFERATLVGAQIASSKMGFFRDPENNTLPTYDGEGLEDDTDVNGNNIISIEPGQFEDIGSKLFEAFDPEYPPAKYQEFVREILRGAASGLNMSYHVFANDPASVNYSTAREFRLQDTDAYRDKQTFLGTMLLTPLFHHWIKIQLLRQPLNRYRVTDFQRLAKHAWNYRGWQWVDPQKEGQGNLLAIQLGAKSYTDIAADQGRDFEEVVKQIARDKRIAEQHGVALGEIEQIVQNESEE